MYKFYEVSKEYRDLVKPERMSTIPSQGFNRLSLRGSIAGEPQK
jgi:hypothetical protein